METKFKTGKHLYAVDVLCDLAKCFRVEASSEEEAEAIVWAKVRKILAQPNPYPLKDLEADGFGATDDAEVRVSGEETVDGEIEYF